MEDAATKPKPSAKAALPRPGGPGVAKPSDPDLPAPQGLFGSGKKSGGLDLDLPAPKAKRPIAPPVGGLDLDLPAPKGTLPKRPAAPAPDLDIDLPAPRRPAAKKAPARPGADLDVDLPAPRKPGARKAPARPGADLDVDLPAPRKPAARKPPGADLDIDLPAPRKPPAPPGADLDIDLPAPRKPPAPPGADLDIDLPAPRKPPGADLDVDLPAPRKPAPPAGNFDLPAPRKPGFKRPAPDADLPAVAASAQSDFDLDLPAPRATAGSDFDLDLPAPAGDDFDLDLPTSRAEPRSALASGGSPFDSLDLPTAKGDADLPSPKGASGFGVDLPQPKSRSVLDEADEAFGDLDLPMPKSVPSAAGGFGDLDLPVPKADIDLPGVQDFGDLDLPTPRDDLPAPGGFGDLDLPTPRDDLSAGGLADLPIAQQSSDLPVPRSAEPAGDFDDLALPEPRAMGGAEESRDASGRSGLGSANFGELDLGDVGASDDMEFADIPQETREPGASVEPEVEEFAPVQPVARPSSPEHAEAPRKKKKSRAIPIAIAVLTVLLAGGAGLHFTPVGAYGINLLEPFMPGAGDPARVSAAIASAEEVSASDRYVDIRTALVTLGHARHQAGINQQLLGRSLVHESLYQLRFNDPGSATRASAIRTRMQERGMDGPDAALGFAADALAREQIPEARRYLGQARVGGAQGPYVELVAGEIELAAEALDAAATAFEAAAEGGAGPRGLWGAARVRLAGEDPGAARAAVDAVLEASPAHGDALTARTRLLLDAESYDDAFSTAERAAGRDDDHLRVAPRTRAEAWTMMGEVHEHRGRVSAAADAFGRAIAALDSHVPALLGAGRTALSDRPTEALARFESVLQVESAATTRVRGGRTELQEAQLGAARAMLATDRSVDAKTILEQLAVALPDDGEIALWLGKAEEAQDPPNHDAAQQHYRDAVLAAPEMFAGYLALAELFLATDRGSDATLVIEQASGHVAETAEMRHQLGEFELRRDDHTAAIRELRRALELDPQLPGAMFSLGVSYRRSGELEQADQTFDQLAGVDDHYPGLSLERGLLFEARGQSERAVAAYQAALEAEPDDLDLLLRLGAAQVGAGRIDDAEETLQQVSDARPNSSEAAHFVGRVAFARGQFAEALSHFRRAVNIDPSRGEFHLYVGWAALENGQLGEALREVDDAIERDSSLGDAYWIRGEIKLRSGRPRDALEDLRIAIRLRPSRYEIYATTGEVHDQLNDLASAVASYQQAVENVDDNGRWFYRLGRLQMDRGNRGEATAALQRATLLGDAESPIPGWLADAHRIRGDALRLGGHGREAIPHYQRYLELAPRSAIDRREVRRRLMDMGIVPPD